MILVYTGCHEKWPVSHSPICDAGARMTDAGLKHLQDGTGLRDLGLIETQVTDAAVRQLKQSLPTTTIWTDQAK
jgi:hypothetical protein